MVWRAACRGQAQSSPSSRSLFISVSVCSRLGKEGQANTMGRARDSESKWELESPSIWLHHHCLPGPQNCARSLTDESSIIAVQPGKYSWKLVFFQCWSASPRICVRSTGIRGWSHQHFYCRAKGKDPYWGGGIMNGKRDVHQSAPPQHRPRYTLPGLKSCYTDQEEPVQTVLRQ